MFYTCNTCCEDTVLSNNQLSCALEHVNIY